MAHAVLLTDEVTAGPGSAFQPLVGDHDVAAHSRGEIDDDVNLALTDALDDFTVVPRLHCEFAGFEFTHVDMHDGGAGLCGSDGGGGNFLGGNRAVRTLGDLGVVAGHC